MVVPIGRNGKPLCVRGFNFGPLRDVVRTFPDPIPRKSVQGDEIEVLRCGHWVARGSGECQHPRRRCKACASGVPPVEAPAVGDPNGCVLP